MRKAVLLALGFLVAVSSAALVAIRQNPPPAFPCIESAREGGLTAVGSGLLLRVEWRPGTGQLSIADEHAPVRWTAISEAEARRTALTVLAPISRPSRAPRSGIASLYVTCDGKGEAWRERARPTSWRECIAPLASETRFACLRRISAPQPSPELAAAGVSHALAQLGLAHGAAPAPEDLPPLPTPTFFQFLGDDL